MIRTRFGTVAVALVTAACGSGPEGSPSRDDASAVGAAGIHGMAPPAARGIPSIIMLTPEGDDARVAPDSPTTTTVDQLGMVFSPRFAVAREGGDIRFTNSESIAHNVTLRSLETDDIVFEAETDPSGMTTFSPRRPGGYDLTCSMHPGMTGFVYVSSAPHAVVASPDGAFTFADVPPGTYSLEIWSVDEASRSLDVVTITESTTSIN